MKRVLLLSGAFAGFTAVAQTITADDTLSTGLSTAYYVMDSAAVSHSAVTGVGVTWNYDTLWAYENLTTPDNIVDASTSPYAADFPMAEYNDDLSGGASIFFSNSGDDSMTVYGYVITAGGSEVIVRHNANPLKALVYPMSVGETYTDALEGEIESGAVSLPSSGSATVTVDGYGTLLVSGNTHTNILRVKLVETIVGSLPFPPVTGTVTRTVYSYYDLANDPQPIFVHASVVVDSDVLNDSYTAVYYSGNPGFAGVSEAAASSFSVYPNPANGMAVVTTDGTAEMLQVINTLGQVVITINAPQATEQINIASLEPGIYMVQVKKGGELINQKLVIE